MILYYLLASLGLTYIIKYGTVLAGARARASKLFPQTTELWRCSLCLGFWTGVMCAPVVMCAAGVGCAVLFPFASAGWCWTIDELHDALVVWRAGIKQKNTRDSERVLLEDWSDC